MVSGRGNLGKRRKEETDLLQGNDFRGCNMERDQPHDMLTSRYTVSGLCSVGFGGILGRLGTS